MAASLGTGCVVCSDWVWAFGCPKERKMTTEIDAQKIYGELGQLREAIQSIKTQIELLGQTTRFGFRTEHPHIVRMEGVHGGCPTIRGTGVSVQAIVEQAQLGRSPQQIVEDFEGVLNLAQVYDALSYYHEHKQEIEQYILENREALCKGPKVANTRSSST
jgi:uncharacterized protein (DUF433 family)